MKMLGYRGSWNSLPVIGRVLLRLADGPFVSRQTVARKDYVSLYGMPPGGWHASGVRLLGRTAVECTRDVLAAAIGRDVAGVASSCPFGGGILALGPFAGSCNTLHWILRHLPAARAVGIELDPVVFDLTARNLATLGLPIEGALRPLLTGLSAVPTLRTWVRPRRRSGSASRPAPG